MTTKRRCGRSSAGRHRAAARHLADALSAYQDAATIAAGLAKADPNNVQSQRDVTFVDERLGNVQVAQGNLTAALASYRASLAAADTLARANPSNAKLQHDVAFFEQKPATSRSRRAIERGR